MKKKKEVLAGATPDGEVVVKKVDDVKPEDKIPTKEKIFYGLGALMDGGGVALMACVLLNYMTDTLLIASAAASTIMLISKIWDAVTDPVMGYISDNTRSRFGRRKPYMFIGGISLIVALFLLFAPIREWGITDQAGMIAWMLIFYMFWNTCSTCSQVPYTSMASDISPSFKERNNANTVKVVFVAVASGIAYLVPLLLLVQTRFALRFQFERVHVVRLVLQDQGAALQGAREIVEAGEGLGFAVEHLLVARLGVI